MSCVGASGRGEAVWACESIASKSRFTNSKSRLGRPGADEKRRGCGGRVPPTHSSTAAWVVGGRRRRAAASGGGGRRATAKIPIYKLEKSIREARRPTKRGGGVGGGCPQPTHRGRPGWWEGGGGGRRRAAAAGGGRRRKSRCTNSKSRLGRPGGRQKEEGVWGAGAPTPFIDAGLGGGRAAAAGGGGRRRAAAAGGKHRVRPHTLM